MSDTSTVSSLMSFDEWLATPPGAEQRLGQHLMNSAPMHIYNAASGVMDLDPFYAEAPRTMYKVNNFIMFAYLVWDVTDDTEIQKAIKMVLDEPNARR